LKVANLRVVGCLALILTGGNMAAASNWPQWRGPEDNGISKETDLPVSWSEGKNIAWKIPMPGKGGATPIVWNDRIFVTSGEQNNYVLLCLDLEGKEIWKRVVSSGGRNAIRGDEGNDASASPSTDGKLVFTYFGTGDLACFDFAGKEIWKFNIQKRYGRFQIQHGIHNTPLLVDDRLYLSILHNGGHWVAALDKATGNEVWKVARMSDAVGESREAYASPILWTTGKERTLVVLGCDYATGHSLDDGRELWRVSELNPKKGYSTALRIIASPIASPDLLVVPTARGGLILGVKPGASGTIAPNSPFELWRKTRGGPDVPSPLIDGGLVYLVQAGGLYQVWDGQSGKEYYEKSLHNDRYRASPVIADGKVYVLARNGTTYVMAAGTKENILSTNKLDDNFTASPAIANGRIYLRGFKSLYAIGKKE
jgi:outer membrane protein assembly factor BamB